MFVFKIKIEERIKKKQMEEEKTELLINNHNS